MGFQLGTKLVQELSKWDKRNGYEISAARSPSIKPQQAFEQWRSSPGHYALIIPGNRYYLVIFLFFYVSCIYVSIYQSISGYWTNLKTVGCGWRETLAHCWFATEEP